MKGSYVCFFLVMMSLTTALSQDKWTAKDIIHTEFIRSAIFSPDNSMVIWSKQKSVKEKDRFVSDLYLTRLNVEKDEKFLTVQLTNSEDNDFNPFFSSDSETIYFQSGREKGKKLWSISVHGGEASEVQEFKNGISNAKLLNDSTIIYRSNEGKSLYEKELEEKKDNVIVVEDTTHWKTSRLYSYSIKNKAIDRLTMNTKPIRSFSTSPDGIWLVYSVTQSTDYASDAGPDPKYFLKNFKTNDVIELFESFDYPCYNFHFTSDNAGFYFLKETGSDPEWNGSGINELFYYDINEKKHEKVPLDWDFGIAGGITIAGNDVIASLANKAHLRLRYYKKGNDWSHQDLSLEEKIDHSQVIAGSKDGTKLLIQYSTAEMLPQYLSYDHTNGAVSNETEFVELNKGLKKKPIAKREVISWKGYQDEEVTGILYYPENYEAGKKYPLMLSIHGGPAGVDLDQWRERWSTYPNILAQRGAFVLKPNYHGSSNHGLAFVESIKKNYYEPELEDIVKGIDKLEKEGKIDMDKLGVMGWSNGAILTTMLTVRYPDMFKVACPGAGDVNWTSDFGTCRFGVSFDQSYFGGAPWDDMNGKFYNENYIIKSPLFELEKVKTPTIIFHGSEDRSVPRDQGWEYYRALQQIGASPVRFLWFPGQPHGLGKITHQMRKMQEELKWIDTYLFEKVDSTNNSFKEDSPLASLIYRSKAHKVGDLFGVIHDETLIPETIKTKSDTIKIGLFEVTNAQFAAYDTAYDFSSTMSNMPAVVSFEEASSYINWLGEKTKQKYRLPNDHEVKNYA